MHVCVGSRLKKDIEFDLLYARVIKYTDATKLAKCVRCEEFFYQKNARGLRAFSLIILVS